MSAAGTARNSSWPMPLLGGPTPFAAIDPNGNLTQKIDGGVTTTYTWDAENRLTQVQNNGTTVATFAYDPSGRRVQKVAGGVTTTWTYDGAAILRQVSGASTLKYIHGGGIDEPLASDDGAALSYFHADGLGSITKTTSAAGAVTLSRQYDSWGNLQAGGTSSGYAFTGREWDAEAGLYYYRARYYDPKVGRFLSEDPIGFTTGVNFYAYVGNSPVRFRDPSGLMEVSGSGQTATYRGVPWLNDQGFFWPQPATLTFKCREVCGGGWKLEYTIQYQYLMKYPTCCPGVQQEEEAHKAAWEAALRKWGAPAERAEGVYPSQDECRRAGERGRAQTMANPMSGPGNEGHGPVDRFWKWLRDLAMGS